jgi:drug/metabolite transporter (DMT)-like permease
MASSPWSGATRTLFGLMVFAWAANYLFARAGLAYATPLWLASLRAGLGALGMIGFLWVRKGPSRLDARGRRDAMLLGVPNTALFFGLWFSAARTVPPGQAAVVIYTFPVWVAMLSSPLLRRHLTRLHWVAVVLGLSGVVLVSEPWSVGAQPGALLAFLELALAPVSWAFATVMFERRFRPEELLEVNAYQLLGGTAALLGAALVVDPTSLPGPAPTLWISALWLGFVGSAFAYAVWFLLLGKVGGADLSSYVLLVPVTALGLSALLLGERLAWLQAVGVGLVLVSIYLVARGGRYGPSRRMPAPAQSLEDTAGGVRSIR